MVIAKHSAEALSALNRMIGLAVKDAGCGSGLYRPYRPLMISLGM